MNLLSVGAAYGVLVMVFQYGWFDGFLGFESLGYINTITPPFLLAVVFGLSMDYEVFLLSRIRERYDATGDTKTAVAQGLAKSAATITSAALIMVAVFAVFAGTGVPVGQGDRPRPRGRHRPRRDDRPAGARAGDDGDHGRVELVAAEVARQAPAGSQLGGVRNARRSGAHARARLSRRPLHPERGQRPRPAAARAARGTRRGAPKSCAGPSGP